jgi:hypothetical protein
MRWISWLRSVTLPFAQEIPSVIERMIARLPGMRRGRVLHGTVPFLRLLKAGLARQGTSVPLLSV